MQIRVETDSRSSAERLSWVVGRPCRSVDEVVDDIKNVVVSIVAAGSHPLIGMFFVHELCQRSD